MAAGWGENSSRQVEAGRAKTGLHLLFKLNAESLVFLQEHLIAALRTRLVAEPDGVVIILDIFDPPMSHMGMGTEMRAARFIGDVGPSTSSSDV
ncbi:MAG: hypothetical protein AAAC47_27250 [Pararhizobium sp.]